MKRLHYREIIHNSLSDVISGCSEPFTQRNLGGWRVEGGAYWAASCCPGQVSHLRWQSVSWHHPLHESRLSVTQHDGSLKVYIIIFRRREEEELQVRLLTGEERFEPARVNVAVYSQAQCLKMHSGTSLLWSLSEVTVCRWTVGRPCWFPLHSDWQESQSESRRVQRTAVPPPPPPSI